MCTGKYLRAGCFSPAPLLIGDLFSSSQEVTMNRFPNCIQTMDFQFSSVMQRFFPTPKSSQRHGSWNAWPASHCPSFQACHRLSWLRWLRSFTQNRPGLRSLGLQIFCSLEETGEWSYEGEKICTFTSYIWHFASSAKSKDSRLGGPHGCETLSGHSRSQGIPSPMEQSLHFSLVFGWCSSHHLDV